MLVRRLYNFFAGSALLLSLNASAGVPYTFTNGTPADATQLNANFTTLVNQIAQLQAQLAALQPAAASTNIVGTWDFVELDANMQTPLANNFQAESMGGRGSLTFTPSPSSGTSGTFTGSETLQGASINYVISSDIYINVATTPPVNAGPMSHVTGTWSSAGSGGAISGSYSVSGNTVTLTPGGGVFGSLQGSLTSDGRMMVLTNRTGDSLISSQHAAGIIVGVKH